MARRAPLPPTRLPRALWRFSEAPLPLGAARELCGASFRGRVFPDEAALATRAQATMLFEAVSQLLRDAGVAPPSSPFDWPPPSASPSAREAEALALGLHECARQAWAHCAERGALLAALGDRVSAQLAACLNELAGARQRIKEAEAEAAGRVRELEERLGAESAARQSAEDEAARLRDELARERAECEARLRAPVLVPTRRLSIVEATVPPPPPPPQRPITYEDALELMRAQVELEAQTAELRKQTALLEHLRAQAEEETRTAVVALRTREAELRETHRLLVAARGAAKRQARTHATQVRAMQAALVARAATEFQEGGAAEPRDSHEPELAEGDSEREDGTAAESEDEPPDDKVAPFARHVADSAALPVYATLARLGGGSAAQRRGLRGPARGQPWVEALVWHALRAQTRATAPRPPLYEVVLNTLLVQLNGDTAAAASVMWSALRAAWHAGQNKSEAGGGELLLALLEARLPADVETFAAQLATRAAAGDVGFSLPEPQAGGAAPAAVCGLRARTVAEREFVRFGAAPLLALQRALEPLAQPLSPEDAPARERAAMARLSPEARAALRCMPWAKWLATCVAHYQRVRAARVRQFEAALIAECEADSDKPFAAFARLCARLVTPPPRAELVERWYAQSVRERAPSRRGAARARALATHPELVAHLLGVASQ
jgi:hypothetical protein